MNGITLSDQLDWFVPNWIANRFFRRVLERTADDPLLERVVTIGWANGGLYLPSVGGAVVDPLLVLISATAESEVGTFGQYAESTDEDLGYVNALQHLLIMIDDYKAGGRGP